MSVGRTGPISRWRYQPAPAPQVPHLWQVAGREQLRQMAQFNLVSGSTAKNGGDAACSGAR
jgi:hypothetical protein